ncbi:MAG: hypothetical protein N5P05_001203 [Chroococcopsis gigantea SAG 12.99]|jgi:hypothetical protein|nr:hypothetical protein [Chroococcopsis gigantea SAG 12.99]
MNLSPVPLETDLIYFNLSNILNRTEDSSDCLDNESRQEILNNVITRLKRSHSKKGYLLSKR